MVMKNPELAEVALYRLIEDFAPNAEACNGDRVYWHSGRASLWEAFDALGLGDMVSHTDLDTAIEKLYFKIDKKYGKIGSTPKRK